MHLWPVDRISPGSLRRGVGRALFGALLVAVATTGGGLLLSADRLALAAGGGFPDVPATHVHYAAVSDLAGRGIIAGYADGTFGPDNPVSRQQFAKMVVLTGGYPVSEADICPFGDVSKSGAGSLFPDNYVAVCAARGITTGKSARLFDPYSSITRLQVVSMVARAADDLRSGLLTAPPAGWTGTARWAADPTHGANAARCEYGGLLAGLDLADLDPSGAMTRGEVAQVLHNLLGRLESSSGVVDVTLTTLVVAGSGFVAEAPARTTFKRGETVTLTAVPAAGFSFTGWGGDAGGFDNPLTFVLDSDKTVTAGFAPTTTALENLGGYITSAPAVCSQGYRLLDVFARGPAGTLVHLAWRGTSWSEWEDLGGAVKLGSDPAVTSWGPGRLDVFIRGADDALRHKAWSDGAWSDWESLGGNLSSGPAAAYRDIGGGQRLLHVFVLDREGRLRQRVFDGIAWSAWATTGYGGLALQPGLAPAVATWGTRRIDLVVCGAGGTLWHSYLPPGGEWMQWDHVGGTYSSAAAVSTWGSWAEDRLDLFVRGANNGLWHATLVSGLWSAWEDLGVGVIASAPAAASWGPDRVDVFVRGTDNALWHKAWDENGWVP